MTIDTRSAAPKGAAPALIPAGPGARPGDAPATHDTFASLVAQLSEDAPLGRVRGLRAAVRGSAPGGGQALTPRSPRAGIPASNAGTPASVPTTPFGASSADETVNALIDTPIDTLIGTPSSTTAPIPAAVVDPSTALPAWLFALAGPGVPPAADLTTAAGTDAADAANADDAQAGFQRIAMPGRLTFSNASASAAIAGSPGTGDARGSSRAQPDAGLDSADVAAGGEVGDSTNADVAGAPASAQSAAAPRGPLSLGTISPADADRTDSSTPALAAHLTRVARAREAFDVGSSDAGVEGASASAPGAAGSAHTRPGATSPGAMSFAAMSPGDASRTASPMLGQAADPARVGGAGDAGGVGDSSDAGMAGASVSVPHAVEPSHTRGGASSPGWLSPGPLPLGALWPGEANRHTSPMPAQADTDATIAQAAAPDRFASTMPADRIVLDRASRSRALFNTPQPPAPDPATGWAGQLEFAARHLANVAATDPTSLAEGRSRPSDPGVSERVIRDEAQMASRAIDALTATARHLEQRASDAAGLLEVVAAGGSQTAAPASTAIPASADVPLAIPDERDLRHQIVRGITFQWRDGVGDVKLTLHPEYLGEMRIELRVDQSGVTAQLSTDSASVRAWAVANEALLRQGLAEQGLTLSRLVVTDEEPSPDRESRRRAPQQDTPEPPASRRSDEATFEIVL